MRGIAKWGKVTKYSEKIYILYCPEIDIVAFRIYLSSFAYLLRFLTSVSDWNVKRFIETGVRSTSTYLNKT